MRELILGLWTLASCTSATCGVLAQAFEDATQQDRAFLAARAELLSARQMVPIAQSGQMPSAAVTLSDAVVTGSRTIDTPAAPISSSQQYRTPNLAFNVRVPLFNLESRQKVRHAEAQVGYAEAVFASRQGELLDRVATAVLQCMLAESRVATLIAERDAGRVQFEQAKRRKQLGEGMLTEVADSEAQLSMSEVKLTEAMQQLALTRLMLQQITGKDMRWPEDAAGAQLTAGAEQVMQRRRLPLDDVLVAGDTLGPSVAIRRQALAVAQILVARNESTSMPKAELVIQASSSRNDSVSTLNQSVRQASLGFQISAPIDVAGLTTASTAQALADLRKAELELEAERQLTARELTRLHAVLDAAPQKLHAHRLAIAAASTAVDAAIKSAARGLSPASDVPVARQRLAAARQSMNDFAADILLVRLRLLIRTGTAPQMIAEDMDVGGMGDGAHVR